MLQADIGSVGRFDHPVKAGGLSQPLLQVKKPREAARASKEQVWDSSVTSEPLRFPPHTARVSRGSARGG